METGTNVTYIPISPKLSVHLTFDPILAVPSHIEDEVDRLWEKAQSEKEVYNGQLFCLRSYDDTRIFGQFLEYRYYMATYYNPSFREILKIYPLGVSGVTLCRGCVLVGRRSSTLAQYGDCLELVPSGSIDTRAVQHGEVDFMRQLMWELEEEAHIGEKLVKEIHPLGLFYSSDVGVYDIGLKVVIELEEYEMVELEITAEYPMLQWMEIEEWERELAKEDSQIVPLSRMLWKRCKEL
jgi:hypothetical protein